MSLDHNSPADFSPKSLYNQCLQSLGFVIKIRYDRTVPTFEVHIHWIILFTSISVSLSVKKLPDGIEHISDGRRRDGEQRTACNGGEAACCRHKQNRDNISGSHRDHQRQMTAEWSLQLLSTAGVIIIFSPLSLALAGTKQPSQKSLPCSRHWLENDIKPDVVLHLCRKKKGGAGGRNTELQQMMEMRPFRGEWGRWRVTNSYLEYYADSHSRRCKHTQNTSYSTWITYHTDM